MPLYFLSRIPEPRSTYTFVEHADRVEIVDSDIGRSVTNDAENVIDDLVRWGVDVDAKTIYYVDTEGRRDILRTEGGKFAGFALGRPIQSLESPSP